MVSLWVLLWWILSWIQGQFWAGFIFISPLNSSLYIQWFSYSLFVIFSVIYFYFELKKNYVVILDFFFYLLDSFIYCSSRWSLSCIMVRMIALFLLLMVFLKMMIFISKLSWYNFSKPRQGCETSVNNCMLGIKYLKNRTKKEVIIVSK